MDNSRVGGKPPEPGGGSRRNWGWEPLVPMGGSRRFREAGAPRFRRVSFRVRRAQVRVARIRCWTGESRSGVVVTESKPVSVSQDVMSDAG